MTIKVGINGFGRIGRMAFRAIAKEFSDIEVVGINDLLDADYLAYMLKYDSVHGNFQGDIAVSGNNLVVNGKTIRLTAERDPANLKWSDIGADLVIECTDVGPGQLNPGVKDARSKDMAEGADSRAEGVAGLAVAFRLHGKQTQHHLRRRLLRIGRQGPARVSLGVVGTIQALLGFRQRGCGFNVVGIELQGRLQSFGGLVVALQPIECQTERQVMARHLGIEFDGGFEHRHRIAQLPDLKARLRALLP